MYIIHEIAAFLERHHIFQIYHRRGHALLKLRQFESSKEAFAKCLDMIGKSDMPSKQRDQFRAKTKKQMTVFNVVKKLYNQPDDTRPKVTLANGPSSSWANLSAKATINDKNQAECVDDVKVGDGLFREPHLVAVIDDPNAEGKLCPYSLKKMSAPVPCTFGSDVTFLNENVRAQADASYHKYEWRFIGSLKEKGFAPIALLALRLVTSLTPEEAVSVGQGRLESLDECRERYREAFRLAVDEPQEPSAEASLTAISGLFLEVLEKSGYTSKMDESDVEALANTIFKALLIAKSYAVPVKMLKSIKKRDELFDGSYDEYPSTKCALGLFPALSKLDSLTVKSDEPDLFWFYFNNEIAVVSSRVLAKGHKLSFSLTRGHMKSETINDMITFKCSNPSCTVGFPLKENTKEKLIRCPMETCNKETNIWLKLKRIQELKELYKQAKPKLVKEDPTEGIKALKYLVQEWEKIIIRPYKDIADLERDLKLALILKLVIDEETWIRERS
jgi:tetratricopeptide (TPR) repeat protein